jgi:hypothetical protein
MQRRQSLREGGGGGNKNKKKSSSLATGGAGRSSSKRAKKRRLSPLEELTNGDINTVDTRGSNGDDGNDDTVGEMAKDDSITFYDNKEIIDVDNNKDDGGIVGAISRFYKQADNMAASQALLLNKELEDRGIIEKITDETGLRVVGKLRKEEEEKK